MKDIALSVILTIMIIGACFIMINEFERWQCNSYQNATHRETKYYDFDTCYIKANNGQWYTKEEYTAMILIDNLDYDK